MAPFLFIFVLFAVFAVFRVLAAWLAPTARPGLAFTETEIAFLFPAPVTRRMLVHFKLLGSQLVILLSSLALTLATGRSSFLGGNPLIHAVGWWLMLSTINLHAIGAAFTVTRLTEGGVSKVRRQAAVIGVIVLLLATIAYTAWRTAPAFTVADAASPATFLRYATSLTNTGALPWLLLPFKLVLGPVLASGWREFFVALGPALALLAVHYVWVLRAETSFEEASIALAEKRSKAIAARRAGNFRFGQGPARARRGPFLLAAAGGRPEIAFLWKNLLSAPSYLRPRTFLAAAAVILAVSSWLGHGSETQRAVFPLIGVCALILALYVLMLGPQLARQDLRNDLANVDILKTYPLRGWQVMLGELLTPAAILTALLWLALLAAALAFDPLQRRFGWLTPGFRGTAAGCLALVMAPLCLLQLMIPNAATLLFPSWAQTTRTRERGLEVMGQRLIFVAGQALVVVLALLPAVVVGGLLWFAAYWAFSAAASIAVATAGVLGVLGLEVGLGLWWLGRRFEKFDLSSESVK